MMQKTLNIDLSTGVYTRIVRMLPGFESKVEDEHDYWEEVFYLEGELVEEKKRITLKRHSYECIPPHTKHGPFKTEVGCELLVITYFSR